MTRARDYFALRDLGGRGAMPPREPGFGEQEQTARVRVSPVHLWCVVAIWAACAHGAVPPVPSQAPRAVRVAFIPFDDRVKLKEAWDLSVDVPRWFAHTVDTIAARDTMVRCVPFDSVQALIRQGRWARREYTTPMGIQGIASRLDADWVVGGVVEKFKVLKRSITGDGALSGEHAVSSYAVGGLDAPLTAGIQGYTAQVHLTVNLYDGRTGQLAQTVVVDADDRDGGLSIWLPTSPDNQEIIYYNMAHSPFGSVYFHKNVLGAVMKRCSAQIRELVAGRAVSGAVAAPVPAQFLEGRILDVSPTDVYINLGSADNVFVGQVLEVLKPERPVLGEKGDTLGWVEGPAGTLTVRSVKSSHFSQAVVGQGSEGFRAGWTVRVGVGAK